MFFAFSKLIWFFISPVSLMVLLLLGGLVLVTANRLVASTALFTAAFLILLATAVFPFGKNVAVWLESRYARPAAMPEKVDGIIVLGGGIDQVLSAARNEAQAGSAIDRILVFAELGQRYPDARLVFTGGIGNLEQDGQPEGLLVAGFLKRLGIDFGDRLVIESTSRNTFENAAYSKGIVKPAPGETWLLVTSAWHMPRSVSVFEKAGWQVIAYPADYMTVGEYRFWPDSFDLLGNLVVSSMAFRESAGTLAYYLNGKSAFLFAPK